MQDKRQDGENQHPNSQEDQAEQQINGATTGKWKVIKQAYVETCDKVLRKASYKKALDFN